MSVTLLTGVIVFAILAFALEWMPIDLVALVCLALLLLFDLVSPEEAVAGFSHPAVITVMMMFILSQALVKAGVIASLGRWIALLGRSRPGASTTALLLLSGSLSAFINNVAAVSILMPVSFQIARHHRFSPSRILLPLSYASILGGTCTLIGTSTNLVVSALAEQHGLAPFSMFELFGLGAILFVFGMAYIVFVGMPRLPTREPEHSLTGKYQLATYLTELRVAQGSRLAGRTVLEEDLSERFRLNVLEIIRGKQKIAVDIRRTRLRPDDVLLVRGTVESILALKEHYGLLLLTDVKLDDATLADENNILAEVQLAPSSDLVGRDLKSIGFRGRFGSFVLALKRHGDVIRDKVASVPLAQWDTLLVFGPRTRVEALASLEDFIPLQEVDLRLHRTPRRWIGVGVVVAVVVAAAVGVTTILEASLLGAVAVLVTRCLTIQEAYRAINWTVIFLVAALIPMGAAIENTGLDVIIGGAISHLGGELGPWGVLAILYLVTSVLSEVVSNNSTAIMMVPVALAVSTQLGVDPRPMLMAVTYAASASFLTPMGYKTNAMVFGPGGYRFSDYLRTGWPLKVAFWGLTTALVPIFWPF